MPRSVAAGRVVSRISRSLLFLTAAAILGSAFYCLTAGAKGEATARESSAAKAGEAADDARSIGTCTEQQSTPSHARDSRTMPADRKGRRFETVGLYIEPAGKANSHDYDFYKACGYNYLEFCEGGFGRRPDLLAKYYDHMAEAIATAQKKGFKVWILVLAGMRQWKGPAESGSAGTFSALNKELLDERLECVKRAVEGLRNADGFAFFAGDPGGDPQGRATVHDCMNMARRVHAIVRERAPRARFTINLWAIAEWGGYPSPFGLEFWKKQVLLSRAIAQQQGLLGPDCGVVFSLDNYYRSLALACYADAGLRPDLYPLASDVKRLQDRGVKPIFGWPYFLVDEIDDGFITPNNVASGGQSQAETRYIRAIIDRGYENGLDGMIANASSIGRVAEPLNIYAFAAMCRRSDLTPEALLEEYAGIVADGRTRGTLGRILRFIENHSNWQNSLPPEYRLKNFDCKDVTSASVALAKLREVVPRPKPPIPLPEPPALYLKRLQKRLDAIAAGKIGGTSPILRNSKNR